MLQITSALGAEDFGAHPLDDVARAGLDEVDLDPGFLLEARLQRVDDRRIVRGVDDDALVLRHRRDADGREQ